MIDQATTMDKILITNLHVKTLLGVYEKERRKPQEVLINISLCVDTREAGKKDDIRASVDYAELVDKVRSLVSKSARFTVEALAEDIAQTCLRTSKVTEAQVRVEKPGILKGVEKVGVEIIRSRS